MNREVTKTTKRLLDLSRHGNFNPGLRLFPSAWILHNFRTLCDCDGDVESKFTKDEPLTNITIYRATESITYFARQRTDPPGKCSRSRLFSLQMNSINSVS